VGNARLHHTIPVALDEPQLRHAGHGTRRYPALVAPYYRVSYLVVPPEQFAYGAWTASLERRAGHPVPLLRQHVHTNPIGQVVDLHDDTDGLHGVLVLADNDAGAAALDQIQTGAITGCSVGFNPITWTDGPDKVRTITAAELGEISLVGVPAYPSAGIIPPAPTPRLAEARGALNIMAVTRPKGIEELIASTRALARP